MAKFNALGSNWTFGEALQVLMAGKNGENQNFEELIKSDEKNTSQEEYFYKGREALRAALRKLNLPAKSRVAMTGFTCLAVYEAIRDEKLVPVIIDIDETLNMDLEKLKAKEERGQIEVVIIQNTFGFTQRRIEELKKWARQKRVALIEDNAHAFGAQYDNGQKTGEVGAMAIFSSSQDKILDSVSGGILLTNEKKYQRADEKIAKVEVPRKQQQKDKWYPLLTWSIRKTYDLGIGKAIHMMARKGKKLSEPMHYLDEGGFQGLPVWQAKVLMKRVKVAEKEQIKRQKKVNYYLENLTDEWLFWRPTAEEVARAAALRWPVKVRAEKRALVITELKKAGYYLSDFWYDAPVGPQKYVQAKGYQISLAQLRRAKEVTATIINLPTHQEITKKDIEKMCAIVKKIG